MKRPALGHLLGYTALTVVLTAGAAQSLAGTKTVFSDDIVDAQVKVADIGAGAVGSSEIIDNSIRSADIGNDLITGDDVKESTLTVTPADNSVTGSEVEDDSLTGADIDESTFTMLCPETASHMLMTLGLCFGDEQTAVSLGAATSGCSLLGLRLPSIGEAMLIAAGTVIWSDTHFVDDAVAMGATTDGNLPTVEPAGSSKAFRCVANGR